MCFCRLASVQVHQPEDVIDASFFISAGDTVPITVMRGEQKLTFNVEAGSPKSDTMALGPEQTLGGPAEARRARENSLTITERDPLRRATGYERSRHGTLPSLTIGIPSFFAFSSLLPASSPASTKLVFLLTLPLTFPPRCRISSAISSRARLKVPVITQVVPLILESAGGLQFRLTGQAQTCRAQFLHHLAIPRLPKKLRDARAHDFADVGNSLQLFRRRSHQLVEIREMTRQRARRAHADMQNPDAEEQTPQRLLFAPLDRLEQLRHALLPHPLEIT